MKWLGWLGSGAIYFVITASLVAGLAASYGRELEAQRNPDRGWWLRRLLIMPVLAIAASAAMELFDLSPSAAGFSAAMLSLGGYDVLRLLESRWLHRLDAMTNARNAHADSAGGRQ